MSGGKETRARQERHLMILVHHVPSHDGNTAQVRLSGSDRRRGLRINQRRPIKVLDTSARRYFGGQTQDISGTGLRIELPAHTPIKPGKIVQIHVGLSSTGEPLANRRQMIPARVVWVVRDELNLDRCITTGIEFLASTAARRDAA